MSIITIITIVLNICQGYSVPWQLGDHLHYSGLVWCPLIPTFSPVVICAAKRDRHLHIRCTSVCFCLRSVCVFCVNECLKWVRIFSSMIGAGSLSEAGLGLGDVDFDAVCAFRGRVLSYWRCALRCHQPLSGFLSLLVHSWVHAPVLPCRQLGLRLLLWHRWWKLLVFILWKSCQEGRGVRYGEV